MFECEFCTDIFEESCDGYAEKTLHKIVHHEDALI